MPWGFLHEISETAYYSIRIGFADLYFIYAIGRPVRPPGEAVQGQKRQMRQWNYKKLRIMQ